MRSFVTRRRGALTALALAALCAVALAPSLANSQTSTACADLLAYYKAAAVAPPIVYDNFGRGGEVVAAEEEEEAAFEGDAMSDGALPASGLGPADLGSRSEAGTNVQVAGVDESDIVKTNGSEIFVLREEVLVVVSVSEDPPRVIGELRFGSARSAEGPREMLLAGERLLIFRSVLYGRTSRSQRGTQLIEIDVRAPARPRVLRTLHTYGDFVTARLVGTAVRVVLTHDGSESLNARWLEQVGGDVEYGYDPYARVDDRSWRELVERSWLSTWLPIYAIEDHTSGRWGWGRLASCDGIQTPPLEQAGQRGTLTTLLLSLDLADGIGEWGSAGVIGATDAVYASTNAVYVAMRDWNTWSSADTTIHRWDLSGDAPTYNGAALVTGELINQFAMSEHRGRLRVATTNWVWPIQSLLTVFEIDEDSLDQVGQLDGLGPTESIYAVRFLGDQAYVVTFRQIDPLYVIDLSDPDTPVLAGELKIPGFSSYLHPLGGGLLLGVGQNADPRTGQPLGLQASLFNVSDPASPVRLDQVDLSAGSRDVRFEHRAFTYHAGRAYVPASPTNDLFAVRVAQTGLELERRITAQGRVLRSLPIGERLHLLLEASLATHDLATLALLSGVYLVPPSGR